MAINYQRENNDDSYTLYCSEENHYDTDDYYIDDEEEVSAIQLYNNDNNSYCNNNINEQQNPLFLQDQDLFFDDEELTTLLVKDEKQNKEVPKKLQTNPSLSVARSEAVEWILKVNGHYSFSSLTAVLAVDYFDRLICSSFCLQTDKPWTTQLAAVACLSLAAKVEETHVPLLLDLQVEDNRYLFEAKAVQRMEMLVLSSLNWKMNPVTPLSFIDHFARRFGFKEYWLCREFISRCEHMILHTISDLRSMQYAPSIIATATMLHVIHAVKPCVGDECHHQLLNVLRIEKDKVEECSKLLEEITARDLCGGQSLFFSSNKRKFSVWSNENNNVLPSSPDGVIDMSFSSSDNSNDSWSIASSSSSVSSSPDPLLKRNRAMNNAELLLEIAP